MRPEKAKRIIDAAFERYGDDYHVNEHNAGLILFNKHFNTPKVKPALKSILKSYINKEKADDGKDGFVYKETPAYYQADLNECHGNLYYIWGRWSCVGRIKYLLNLLELINTNEKK